MSADTSPRILVVEDEALLARVIECLLTHHGLRVDVAGHGGEAMEQLQTSHFDLIITDLMMPHVDGEQLVRWIRGEAALATPVIVLSASRDAAQCERLRSLGVNEVLHKPLDMDHFVARALALTTHDD